MPVAQNGKFEGAGGREREGKETMVSLSRGLHWVDKFQILTLFLSIKPRLKTIVHSHWS